MQGDKAEDGAAGLQSSNGQAPFPRKAFGASGWGLQPMPGRSSGYFSEPLQLGMAIYFFIMKTGIRGKVTKRQGQRYRGGIAIAKRPDAVLAEDFALR